MPDIKDSVGDGGKNNVHDVALVQAMLRVIKNAKGKAYLGVNYDGAYATSTKTAITDFQTEKGLIASGTTKPALPDTAGLVSAKSATWIALVAALPADHASMTIIEGTNTVYLEGSAGHRDAGVKAMHTEGKLDPVFRGHVADGIKAVYDKHKLALWAGALGRHRTFAEQFNLPPGVTKVGPGESNHNFGHAVDLQFKGFRWIAGDGSVVDDTPFLEKLAKVSNAKATAFWDARDVVLTASPPGLFTLKAAWDRPHVQDYDQSKVSSSRSLVALLNAVGSMKWGPGAGQYKSDLGLGGGLIDVGTSKQIWAGASPVAAADVTAALKAAAVDLPTARAKWDGTFKPGVPLAKGAPGVTAADVASLHKALKREFQAADTNYLKWKPVP